jgi:uncharacterized protein (UPF0276 family)
LKSADPKSPGASLGLGIGWRPEIALAIERRNDLGFVEVVAENLSARTPFPPAIELLQSRGVQVIPHGISLSLGSADRPDPKRLRHLANLATHYRSPLVSEHIAFVRADGIEAGHLLPLPHTRAALNILIENVRIAADSLPVPLALENISALFKWPDAEMEESEFVSEIIEKTDTLLLLDLSNVHANTHNLGGDPMEFLSRLPLDRLAYVHIGGGIERDGVYHDSHSHSTPQEALDLLRKLRSQTSIPGAMLERDDNFPSEAELNGELDSIRAALYDNHIRALDHGK